MLDFTISAQSQHHADLKPQGPADVEQLLWSANSALFDLCAALRKGMPHRLSPNDVATLVEQSKQAEWLAINGSNK